MKRIGLDARIGRHTSVGSATYIREVAARVAAFVPEDDVRTYERGGTLDLGEQVFVPLAMRRDRLDLVHFLQHYMPLALPERFVFTIHDLIHLRFIHMFKAYIGPYYGTIVKRAVRRAQRIIVSDGRTIADLVHYLDADPAKVRVVPLAPREEFVRTVEPYAAERPYLLNVGNHREHKDVPTLLRAWAALPAHYDVDLYLTGPDDFNGELQRLSTARRRAIALGNVSDAQLASLYAGARALVHPALLEGFGLPFVEAMATGCPVIATTESIPEPVASAALLFRPRDVEAARAQIERVLDDEALRTSLVEQGRVAARALTWDRTARETAAIYRDVLEGAS